jgi:hypothetical protein
MAEIILMDNPKLPAVERRARTPERAELLEELVPTFVEFVNSTGRAVLEDAQSTFPLNERRFRGK